MTIKHFIIIYFKSYNTIYSKIEDIYFLFIIINLFIYYFILFNLT